MRPIDSIEICSSLSLIQLLLVTSTSENRNTQQHSRAPEERKVPTRTVPRTGMDIFMDVADDAPVVDADAPPLAVEFVQEGAVTVDIGPFIYILLSSIDSLNRKTKYHSPPQ